jgi:hypothetical protein
MEILFNIFCGDEPLFYGEYEQEISLRSKFTVGEHKQPKKRWSVC